MRNYGYGGYGFGTLGGNSLSGSASAGLLWSAATTGAIADAAAWSVTGGAIAISGGAMVLTAASNTQVLTLTGAYATAFNAVIASNAAFNVQVDITAWSTGASVRMRLKGNVTANYGSVSGNGTQSFVVTSGAGSGIAIFGDGTPYTYTITDIRIYA